MTQLETSQSVRGWLRTAPARRVAWYPRLVKPLIDRALGVLLLVLAAPTMAVVALLVLWQLGAPVLLRQERVGLGGRTFQMYKFRTMLPDRRQGHQPFAGEDRRRTHKSLQDPRHTPLGRVLRRWSLDELPQLLNVVAGQMSLVGPRPELPDVVGRYADWQHRRHDVRPGLTGLWQISDRRHELMFECTELDLEYLDGVSLRTDLRILLQTVPAALGRAPGR